MSVLIKGMEMPKGCATCPYYDRAGNKPKCKAKSMQGRFMEQRLNLDRTIDHTRQKWCPLVPVPQHGDLISREWLIDIGLHLMHTAREGGMAYNLMHTSMNDYIANGVKWLLQYIINAPTIIPAEGEKVDDAKELQSDT